MLHRVLLCLLLCAFVAGCGDDDMAPDVYSAEAITSSRKEKDEQFSNDDSPIPSADRSRFHGLNYFEPNENYAVYATLERAAKPDTVQIQATRSGDVRRMLRVGKFRFELGGKTFRLSAFRSLESGAEESSLFVPFADETNGQETYEAGRYMDVVDMGIDDEDFLLDFNMAYNPYCAYNKDYSCPVVPRENHLSVAIPAGEKNYAH